MNIDELVEWLDKNGAYEYTPWERWFEKNYCKKCATVVGCPEDLYGEHMCSWCELHRKCRFFQDMSTFPSRKQVIRLWLESEN